MAQHISRPQAESTLKLISNGNESAGAALHADILMIGCSDFEHAGPMSAFDGRNVTQIRTFGNSVPPYESRQREAGRLNVMFGNLGVRHIIVLGHTQCETLHTLYRNCHGHDTQDTVCTLVHAQYAHLDEEGQLNVLAQENVLVQLENLLTYPAVQKRTQDKTLSLAGWLYEKETWQLYCYDLEEEQFVPLQDFRIPVKEGWLT